MVSSDFSQHKAVGFNELETKLSDDDDSALWSDEGKRRLTKEEQKEMNETLRKVTCPPKTIPVIIS